MQGWDNFKLLQKPETKGKRNPSHSPRYLTCWTLSLSISTLRFQAKYILTFTA